MAQDPKVGTNFVMPNPPVYTKLSIKREANARRQHLRKQYDALSAPLPPQDVEYIQKAAAGAIPTPKRTDMQIKMEKERNAQRQQFTRYLGRYHRMTRRFLKRRYQILLADYIPYLKHEKGQWHVSQVKSLQGERKFPTVSESQFEGYTLRCGERIRAVDENGAFTGSL